jgi:uncharacterized membrane protein YidH (DUF202 family)
MTAKLARLALRLYPLAYQRRYGDEMRALLDDEPPRTRAVFDLFKGALLAHLRPADGPSGALDPADRVRASTRGVLLCWVFFAAAGFGFYKTTEDEPFSLAGHAHPLLRDAHLAVQALAVIASMTVVLAALPLVLAAVSHARSDSGMRRKVLLPFLPLILFGALTAGVLAIAHTQAPGRPTTAGYGMAIVWGIAGLACGMTCVLACRHALFATPARASRLRAALIGATVVTFAMLGIAIATALYAIALNLDASELAAQPNGPFNVISTTTSLILQVAVMVGAALLATIATARAWRVESELATA